LDAALNDRVASFFFLDVHFVHPIKPNIMEKQFSIVALVLSIGGLGYLKAQQLDRMAEQAVIAEAAAAEAAALAQAEADNAARLHFEVPHDRDATSNELDIVLDGSASYDMNSDSLTFTWAQTEGAEVELTHEPNGTSSFRAAPGKYTFELTVTDAYGAAVSEKARLSIDPEPNDPPMAAISVTARAAQPDPEPAEGDGEE
jgi:hypothetical protein